VLAGQEAVLLAQLLGHLEGDRHPVVGDALQLGHPQGVEDRLALGLLDRGGGHRHRALKWSNGSRQARQV